MIKNKYTYCNMNKIIRVIKSLFKCPCKHKWIHEYYIGIFGRLHYKECELCGKNEFEWLDDK